MEIVKAKKHDHNNPNNEELINKGKTSCCAPVTKTTTSEVVSCTLTEKKQSCGNCTNTEGCK